MKPDMLEYLLGRSGQKDIEEDKRPHRTALFIGLSAIKPLKYLNAEGITATNNFGK
ncbi:MAG: hypothetical protein LBE65_05025 [Synergistaceae bacterium]|nr:hypothetical protein [Synergistaceae bacterium]